MYWWKSYVVGSCAYLQFPVHFPFVESSMLATTPTVKEETYMCQHCNQHMADEFSLKVNILCSNGMRVSQCFKLRYLTLTFNPHLKYLLVALCFKIESTVVLFLLQIHMAAYHAENMKEVNIHESTELQPRKSRVIHSLDHKGNLLFN